MFISISYLFILIAGLWKGGYVSCTETQDEETAVCGQPTTFLDTLQNDIEVVGAETVKVNLTFMANTSIYQLEDEAAKYMRYVNEESAERGNKRTMGSWLFSSNITDYNKKIFVEEQEEFAAFARRRWADLQTWKTIWPKFENEDLKRQFDLYSVLGIAVLPEDKFQEYTAITTNLKEIYSTATICDYYNQTKCDLSLEPDLYAKISESRDYEELTYVWKSWRDASGKKMKQLFSDYVALANEAAALNGFDSMAEMWNDPYETPSLEEEVAKLYQEIKPLYQQLHAYCRRKLRKVYGEDKVPRRGAVPAHLFGNMWAQSWTNLYDLLIPFPGKTSVDITDAMKALNYTPNIMFEKADDFFFSLGFDRVNRLFWEKSIIEKPEDRNLTCHASAWDFSNRRDFRIKQCTKVKMEDFFTVHHEMGHIQYFMQYKNLPTIFRGGANSGFHEAVGDVMSMSVSTPKHLEKLGLLDFYKPDLEADLNFLMLSALKHLAFLPFGYLVDKWRWDVFRGLVKPDNYTCSWWNYRYELQGIKPPVERTGEDFDPGAKYHIAADTEYIEYFISHVLQFQFHKAACLLAGEYDPEDSKKPLYQCDIYQSEKAGNAIRNMLQLGRSKHWKVALKALTGIDHMSLSPLREFFSPLEEWLRKDNLLHKEFIGWKGGNGVC